MLVTGIPNDFQALHSSSKFDASIEEGSDDSVSTQRDSILDPSAGKIEADIDIVLDTYMAHIIQKVSLKIKTWKIIGVSIAGSGVQPC